MATDVKSALSTTNRTGQAAPDGGTFDYSYTTLADFAAGQTTRGKDLVTRDVREILYCYDDWPSGLNSVYKPTEGWTTDSTRYTWIRGVDSTNGLVDGGFWINSSQGFGVMAPKQEYFRLTDIGIYNSSSAATAYSINFFDSDDSIMERCVVGGASGVMCLDGRRMHYENCILYALGVATNRGVLELRNWGGEDPTVYNVTIIGGYYSINPNQTWGKFKNVICYGYSQASVDGNMTNATGETNIAADGVLPGSLAIILTDADFVDVANDDYHLASGSQAQDVGTDVSVEAGFSDDIDGDTRVAPWDVGADEIAGVTPVAAKNPIMHGNNF